MNNNYLRFQPQFHCNACWKGACNICKIRLLFQCAMESRLHDMVHVQEIHMLCWNLSYVQTWNSTSQETQDHKFTLSSRRRVYIGYLSFRPSSSANPMMSTDVHRRRLLPRRIAPNPSERLNTNKVGPFGGVGGNPPTRYFFLNFD